MRFPCIKAENLEDAQALCDSLKLELHSFDASRTLADAVVNDPADEAASSDQASSVVIEPKSVGLCFGTSSPEATVSSPADDNSNDGGSHSVPQPVRLLRRVRGGALLAAYLLEQSFAEIGEENRRQSELFSGNIQNAAQAHKKNPRPFMVDAENYTKRVEHMLRSAKPAYLQGYCLSPHLVGVSEAMNGVAARCEGVKETCGVMTRLVSVIRARPETGCDNNAPAKGQSQREPPSTPATSSTSAMPADCNPGSSSGEE